MKLAAALLLILPMPAAAQLVSPDMAPEASSSLEGRPAPADTSPLQPRIDAARPGDTLVVEAGSYAGDLLVDRPLTLLGRGRPRLVGSGHGSVVRVRANGVTLQGFDIDGRGEGDLARDTSGVHVAANGARLTDLVISRTLFGVYLRSAEDVTVERCVIRGIPGKDAGEKGSGIHVFDSRRFRLIGNEVSDVRDGLYIQASPQGVISGNTARDLRYGIHFMYSDDNSFEDNLFENGAAGSALMYSKRLVFRRNRFLRNRGFASVGLLFKACEDSVAEDNLIADNARGIFLEGSYRNLIRRNVVAQSDTAIVLYDSCARNRITGNSFVANLTPLTLVGRRTDTDFDGNYWSDNGVPDLDGDGRSDRPFALGSVFDHLRGNLTAADLMAQGLGAAALAAAERSFPVLQPPTAVDRVPLARPPRLPDVPEPRRGSARRDPAALGAALGTLCFGGAVLARGRRRAS